MHKHALGALVSACAFLPVCGQALAQDVTNATTGLAFSTGYSTLDGDKISGNAWNVRATYGYHKNFAVELDLAKGVSDEAKTVLGLTTRSEIRAQAAAFVAMSVPVDERFALRVRAGYHTIGTRTTAPTNVVTEANGQGFAIGIGATAMVTPTLGARIDVTSYDTNKLGDARGWTFSGVYKF